MNIFRFFPTGADTDPAVTTIPDTALLIKQRPFFIPDYAADHCTVTLCVAVHITRLGHSIHEEFAHRYYDHEAVTLAAHFVARDLYDRLRAAGQPVDIAVGFDEAVTVAGAGNLLAARRAGLSLSLTEREMFAPAEGNGSAEAGVTRQVDAVSEAPIDAAALTREIDRRIAWLSQYYMLRQGDVLLFPLTGVPERVVSIGETVRLTLDGAAVWTFYIK